MIYKKLLYIYMLEEKKFLWLYDICIIFERLCIIVSEVDIIKVDLGKDYCEILCGCLFFYFVI